MRGDRAAASVGDTSPANSSALANSGYRLRVRSGIASRRAHKPNQNTQCESERSAHGLVPMRNRLQDAILPPHAPVARFTRFLIRGIVQALNCSGPALRRPVSRPFHCRRRWRLPAPRIFAKEFWIPLRDTVLGHASTAFSNGSPSPRRRTKSQAFRSRIFDGDPRRRSDRHSRTVCHGRSGALLAAPRERSFASAAAQSRRPSAWRG